MVTSVRVLAGTAVWGWAVTLAGLSAGWRAGIAGGLSGWPDS